MSDFIVHLVSNVSPDLYPSNNPSNFSTLLAQEINLDNGNWEVAVREIMYPTHIATTSTDDKIFVHKYSEYYRNLLPHPPRKFEKVERLGVNIDFSNAIKELKIAKVTAKDDEINLLFNDKVANLIVNQVNSSKWSKMKNILQMKYISGKQRFVLEIFKSDIVVLFADSLRKNLGFKNTCYVTGSHESESKLNFKKASLGSNLNMYIMDIQTLESEQWPMPCSIDLADRSRLYEQKINNLFFDTIPDDYYQTPSYKIVLNPKAGVIQLTPILEIPQQYKKHEKQLLFIRFDDMTTKLFGLQSIYAVYNEKTFEFPVVKQETTELVNSARVQLIYGVMRELTHEIDEEPLATITVNANREISDPNDLISILNNNSNEIKPYINAYKFEFDSLRKRFQLKVSDKYAIKMTKSLASILGYEPLDFIIYHNGSHMADDFPLLNRGITALYVYCNIIDSVFVGNVKAPLLLTCPFKKMDKQDFVNRLEFLNPTYISLNRKNIQRIDIGIYDDSGVLIPFLYGKTNVTLDFRRKK